MSDDIYDGVDGEDVANLYDELYTFITDYANAQSTEQAKFKKKYPKKYGTIRRLLVNEIHSSNKAEGGIVGLFNNGGAVDGFSEDDDVANYSVDDSGQYTGSGSDEDSAEADAYQATEDYYQRTLDDSPQVKGGLKSAVQKAIDEGRLQDIELEGGFGPNNRTMVTGVYNPVKQLPGLLGLAQKLMGIEGGKVYSGYGAGARIPDSGDSGEEPSKMIKKIVEEKKKDAPLTEAELDYYGRGIGTASKPMKTLADINEFIGGLYSDTTSPIGATLSKDKRFLTLPNGKVIDLRTGREVEKMQGLELFKGGRI